MTATQIKYNDIDNSKNSTWEIVNGNNKKRIKVEQIGKKHPQKSHGAVMPLVGEEIQQAKEYLLNRPERYAGYGFNMRDYTLFCFGINVGLRYSDLMRLKISDVMKNGEIVDFIRIREQKTRNYDKPLRIIDFKPGVQELLMNYIHSLKGWKPNWYLFHGLWPKRTPYKMMTKENLLVIMKDIEKGLNLQFSLGTHSLRKTFARNIFDKLADKGVRNNCQKHIQKYTKVCKCI